MDGTRPLQTEVTNEGFAEEVRRDRLTFIWKVTLSAAVFLLWVFVALDIYASLDLAAVGLIPWLWVIGGCLACAFLLRGSGFELATWAYNLGILVAVSWVLYNGEGDTLNIAPFFSLLAIYVAGLLLPPRSIIYFVSLSLVVLVAVPSVREGVLTSPSGAIWATFLIGVSTSIFSVQVSNDIYGIADWALENYRRERDGAARLWESRQQIEKSLLRQRALTEQLTKTNEDLAVARQTAEEAKHFRGQFLANMSHELRTPLNAVIGFSETMLNFPAMYNMVELPEEYRGDLRQINSSGTHLLNIINDILDLSKIDAGRLDIEIKPVELEPILKGVMSTAVGLVGGKPIKLTRETPEKLPLVKGDPVRIRQVLLNLYSNAAKFTEEGSIKLKLTHDDAEVVISLTDSGEGIHKDDVDKIFEEFRQGTSGRKQARAGSGLGLPISRQLLDLMGGRLWVESTLGKGSTFFFSLPISKEEPMPVAPVQS